ncbi:hypothetical protein OAM67_00045 [bacterium]|nr:hypothetical protein [bacterium]
MLQQPKPSLRVAMLGSHTTHDSKAIMQAFFDTMKEWDVQPQRITLVTAGSAHDTDREPCGVCRIAHDFATKQQWSVQNLGIADDATEEALLKRWMQASNTVQHVLLFTRQHDVDAMVTDFAEELADSKKVKIMHLEC